MASPTHGQPRVIRLGPRPRAAADDAHRPGGRPHRVRHLAAVPAAALLAVASLLWPFLVLAPLAGAGPDRVRLVQDDDTADLGVAYGPGGAGTVTADGAPLVVDQVSFAFGQLLRPGIAEPGTVLDPSALAASGIPEVALRAYEAAAASLDASDPGCALPWWLLAGIGRVESNHGRFAGAVLLEDGTSSPPVTGIPLDGRDGVALITDSDDGLLDGDTTYDRAVGPMQFIPTTWAGWQSDGDGDGRADPHDIQDAALAAGRYLCGGGADLSTEDGLRSAVFRYNHSDAYVDLVLAIGRAYASGAAPVLPAGNATAPTPTTSAPVPTTTPPPTTAPTTTPPSTSPTTSPTEPVPTCTPAPDPTASPTSPTTPPISSPTDPPPLPPCEPCPTADPTGTPTADPTAGPTPSPTCTVPTTTPTTGPTETETATP